MDGRLWIDYASGDKWRGTRHLALRAWLGESLFGWLPLHVVFDFGAGFFLSTDAGSGMRTRFSRCLFLAVLAYFHALL